ncbi:MAG: hypothetical protein H6961_11460 [Chromatiaceae bacterium]|nr:hypothetical protein [Chromatiaceae bacterium]
MPTNINAAFRIREILESVVGNPDNEQVLKVWAKLFEIQEPNQHRRGVAVSRVLADLHDEVELVRSEMNRLGYSPGLYDGALDKCNRVFAGHAIMGQWNSLKQHITADVRIALGFCSEILPNEENQIDLSDLQDLRALAAELRAQLEKSELSARAKAVVEKHLAKIEEALASYAAVGVKGLEEAMQSAYGEVITNEAVFEEAKGSTELGMLSKLWKKTKTVIDGVTTINKGLGSAQGIAEKGRQLIEYIQNL